MVVTPVGHSMAMHWGIGAAFLNFQNWFFLTQLNLRISANGFKKRRSPLSPPFPHSLPESSIWKIFKYDLTSLSKICVGGAPAAPELLRGAYEKLNCIVINGFGSSGYEHSNKARRQHGRYLQQRGEESLSA